MAENFDKQEPAEKAPVNTAHLLGDQYQKPESQKSNVADQVAQVGNVGDNANKQAADKSEAKQFSANDLKVASADPEVTAMRANLGDSAKNINEGHERLTRGPASGEAQRMYEHMCSENHAFYSGKSLQDGKPRGNADMLLAMMPGDHKFKNS